MYKRLITDADFLDEGDIFLLISLVKNLMQNEDFPLLDNVLNFSLIRVAA